MKTTKPIATISYNSRSFLKGKLEDLSNKGLLVFWCFIEHKPEEDEHKSHFHVFMQPAKAIDTLWLAKQFLEVEIGKEKPRACLPIGCSKFVDWYWYGLHDKAYLASKNQARKYHYLHSDMVTNEQDYLDELVRLNPNPKAQLLQVLDMLKAGKNIFDIAIALNVKIKDLGAFTYSLRSLAESADLDELRRADTTPHDEVDYIESEDF